MWKNITHVEMEVFNPDMGNGWGGTYFAFFIDGSHYCNNDANVTGFEYRVNVVYRREDFFGKIIAFRSIFSKDGIVEKMQS